MEFNRQSFKCFFDETVSDLRIWLDAQANGAVPTQDIEDVISESYYRLHRKRESLVGEHAAKATLYTYAKCLLKEWFSRQPVCHREKQDDREGALFRVSNEGETEADAEAKVVPFRAAKLGADNQAV